MELHPLRFNICRRTVIQFFTIHKYSSQMHSENYGLCDQGFVNPYPWMDPYSNPKF